MSNKKTGTAKGYRIDAIPVEISGDIHNPDTFDICPASNIRAVKTELKGLAKESGLSSLMAIEESAIRITRKWRVDFADIMRCPSFEWVGDPVEIPDIPDEVESDSETV